MNPDELKELAKTLNGIADGKPWQIGRRNEWNDPLGNNPMEYLTNYKIRLKPWELGRSINGHTLPPGAEWYRQDFTEDMLPPPYRPLMLKEEDHPVDEIDRNDGKGFVPLSCPNDYHCPSENYTCHTRTTRPIPFALTPEQIADGWVLWNGGECPVEPESRPELMLKDGSIIKDLTANNLLSRVTDAIIAYKPDPYGHLRQARADGKVIQMNDIDGNWMDWDNPSFGASPHRYRIKPEPQWLPLGPEDVPPGSVLRFAKERWYQTIVGTCDEGAFRVHMDRIRLIEWGRLFRENFEINRSLAAGKWDPTLWEPCRKEAP